MFIPFEEMPKQARVWVYQAERPLSTEECEITEAALSQFLEQWTAHNQSLKASGGVFQQRFVILALDEDFNAASGCSIDASVHFLQDLGKQLKTDFFDRSVAFLSPDKALQTAELKDLKHYIAEGLIQSDTTIFNNLVKNIEELEQAWQQPAKASWLARYF